jgi:class 3 adenylate cyclase
VSRGPGTFRQGHLAKPWPSATGLPHHRTILAVDIESSTTRTNPIKAELRTTLYELFDAALCSAGICERHRDRFFDRGDGALALIHPVEQGSKVPLLSRALPTLNQLLTDYNASLPRLGRAERPLRIRVVVHAGEVHYDVNGCFGEALDVAFRLLDAPPVKKALRVAASPLILVVSEDIYRSVVRQRYDGIDQDTFHPLVRVQIAGDRYRGWIHSPKEAAQARIAEIVEYRRPA